jgi:hypothetical protein
LPVFANENPAPFVKKSLTCGARIFSIANMARTRITKITLLSLLLSSPCATLFAQSPALSPVSFPADDTVQQPDAAVGSYAVFSNLDSDGSYNPDAFAAKAVAGRQAGGGQDEEWYAVRFIPRADVQVKQLSAAIGYISGDKLVNLALYDNNDIFDTPGNPLPGGGGSTRDIPDLGQCCEMATVRLAGDGVFLQSGVTYWLVASPDNVRGPTFSGKWHVSNFGSFAGINPPFLWVPVSGEWPAAEFRGTRLQGSDRSTRVTFDESSPKQGETAANLIIFSNLDPIFGNLYTAGFGTPVAGSDAESSSEVWLALPFTPKDDVHAKTVAVAIAHVAGTKKIVLGVYTDNGGIPGTLLPGGQSSTTNIPESGECCELATARLPGMGVALTGGTQYWLVASTNDRVAADFFGLWQLTTVTVSAYTKPGQFGWIPFSGEWFAAEIRGSNP